MADYSIGFMYGIVTDVDDPQKVGRVRLRIPGMFEEEHPEWARPAGWPGAGGLEHGSRYPMSVGAQVAVFFELGDLHAPPIFLPMHYGVDPATNTPAGPTANSEAEDPNKVTTIWEDDQLSIFVTRDPDTSDRRIVLQDKRTATNITLDAADGTNGKSASITIAANTSVNITSNGIIDLDAPVVQIQGRRVMRGNTERPGNKSI